MNKGASAKFAICVASAALCMPAAAQAQAAPAGSAASLALSKSEAILGAPSALDAILAEQHAQPRAQTSLRPASYSISRPALAYAQVRAPDAGARSGRPDVFGTVALKVGHTPLDARWHAVEHSAVAGTAARFAQSLSGAAAFRQLEAVNWYVNRRVRFADDEQRFGRADVWSTANETLRSGRGDCEDFAIAKMQMLRAAGFSQRDLYLVIVRDLVRRADHALLVARLPDRMVVLDNGTDELLDTSSVSDYRPVLTFASTGEWTHGYRLDAPINVAANELPVTISKAALPQRSLSASLLAFNTGFSR